MYWVVLSCFSLFDYWTWFILSWLPFYAYLRLIVLSYLVLPQTQGAKLIYQTYIHPFFNHHEKEIDRLITSTHERAVAAGLGYLKKLVQFVKENFLGLPQKSQPPSRQVVDGNYASNLLSRFNLPSARQGLAAPAGDFYGLISSAMGTIASSTGGSREAQIDNLSRSGALIPPYLKDPNEKMSWLSTTREHMRIMLAAMDKEASDLSTEVAIERDVDKRLVGEQLKEGAVDGLKKSKSEAEFEEIGRDQPDGGQDQGKSAGSWMPWRWGADAGKSFGVDPHQ